MPALNANAKEVLGNIIRKTDYPEPEDPTPIGGCVASVNIVCFQVYSRCK